MRVKGVNDDTGTVNLGDVLIVLASVLKNGLKVAERPVKLVDISIVLESILVDDLYVERDPVNIGNVPIVLLVGTDLMVKSDVTNLCDVSTVLASEVALGYKVNSVIIIFEDLTVLPTVLIVGLIVTFDVAKLKVVSRVLASMLMTG